VVQFARDRTAKLFSRVAAFHQVLDFLLRVRSAVRIQSRLYELLRFGVRARATLELVSPNLLLEIRTRPKNRALLTPYG
jgi:hypothetical protein